MPLYLIFKVVFKAFISLGSSCILYTYADIKRWIKNVDKWTGMNILWKENNKALFDLGTFCLTYHTTGHLNSTAWLVCTDDHYAAMRARINWLEY